MKVKGSPSLKKGTAIATFVDKKCPNHAHGNHAALYVEQDATGMWVVDQWSGTDTISKRKLRFKGVDRAGKYVDVSNNGDAFSVIE